MLIIEGWLKLGTGEFDKVADAARAMVAETVKEAGCLTYAFSRDINDPDLIRIAERWKAPRPSPPTASLRTWQPSTRQWAGSSAKARSCGSIRLRSCAGSCEAAAGA